MSEQTLVVYVTCPDADTAAGIAGALVEQHLAACVNQLRGVVSTYRWQGRIETDEEILLLIKTRAACFDRLSAAITARHPDDVPEIIAVPVERGLASYLDWVGEQTR